MNGPISLGRELSIAPDVVGAPRTARGGGRPQVEPSFRVLLEQLQDRARQLSHETSLVDRPEQIPGVVEDARGSLEAARSLSERMLEAYRRQVSS